MKKIKRFVIGDIHGRIEALKEVLTKSKFNYKKDKLIVLGDIVDGGYNTYEVVEELLKIKNLIYIVGNHDEWFMNHIRTGWTKDIWLSQGGRNTLESYRKPTLNIPVTHQDFFNRGVYYYVEDNVLFVHGGINPKIPKLESQLRHDLIWDRDLIRFAHDNSVDPYKYVFVGHTTTQTYGLDKPTKFNNLIMMDCGAGWNGKLAILNIDTFESWLSEIQKPSGRM